LGARGKNENEKHFSRNIVSLHGSIVSFSLLAMVALVCLTKAGHFSTKYGELKPMASVVVGPFLLTA
jgi:hypothetical protein